jgi:nanoRNase/pAp phosphatase (c-di-AMP/oligoRNAs hydrolase)
MHMPPETEDLFGDLLLETIDHCCSYDHHSHTEGCSDHSYVDDKFSKRGKPVEGNPPGNEH